LDELFEALTLVQTGKVTRFPVVLLGTAYWSGLIAWVRNTMLPAGMIHEADLQLVTVTDDVDEAVAIVRESQRWGSPAECESVAETAADQREAATSGEA
jgi:predicted Rossmann-fold nucleotide-binding protein